MSGCSNPPDWDSKPPRRSRRGFAVEHVSRTSVDETWTQPWGENKENRSRYNEMAVRLRNGGGVRLTLRFRLFDDGWDSATNMKRPGRIRSA